MSRVSASSAWREGRLWKGYSLVALALAMAYFVLGDNTDAQSAIYGLLGAAAPVAILVGVRHHRPEQYRHWLLLAGGLVLWCVGDTYWNFYVWVLGKQAPYPSFADLAYLCAYPLLIGGVLLWSRGGSRPRVGDLLDAAIVALGAGVVSMIFLLEPLLSTSDSTFLKVIAGGIPVLDVVLLIALTQLLFRGRMTNFALRAFMVGGVGLLVADAAYSYLGLKGLYTVGMTIDAGWLACYALWGTAALHPSMARIEALKENERVGLSTWRIGALLLALLVAPSVLIAQAAAGQSVEVEAIGLVIIATMLLVSWRVWILQRDSTKSQAALAQANEKMGLAHHVAGISTWNMDLVTGRLWVSHDLAMLIKGSSGADVTLQDWVSFVHPGDRNRVTKSFERARASGGDFEYEYRFRSPNGTEGWHFSRGRVFLEETGAPRAYGVVVDITLRRWMEEQLQRSEEGMRLAQEVGSIGTWDTDLQTGETTWSQNLRRIAGVDEDVVGNHDLFLSLVHPDDRAGLDAAMIAAEDNTGHPEFEYRLVRPDGEVRWLLSRGDAVAGPDGKATRFLGVAVDITHRHAMEERLAHSEERLQLAQELGGVGTWDTDLQTGETTWSKNLRRLSGVDDDMEGSDESFMALVYPDDRAGLQAAMATAVANGDHFEFEYRLVRPNDGELRWMLTRGDAVRGPDGHSTRFLGVAVDITDRHLAEEHRTKLEHQLRQAHKLEAVGRLAGGVAHDFNNILLAIRGNGGLAIDALKHGDNAVEEVEEMVAASERAAALTAQLLAFSRQQVLQPEVLDLNEVVHDMDKLLRRMIGEDVELHSVVADKPVHLSADRSQVEQVIANLAVNARDAMPGGGQLTLEVTTTEIGSEEEIDLVPGRYAMLTVSDTGRGMDAETLAKIFEPFFTTKDDGSGFGLPTVHGIVVQSGGSIWVYSEVDHGTTFKVFLPLAEQAQPLESRKPDRAASITQSSGETILLVEDDPHVQRIVRNILHKSRYRVLPANGGEEALELAKAENGTIDLLLSDLVMPGTSGRQLAEQIQAIRPDIAILYMSGYTDDAVVRRGVLDAGMAFIQKPFGAEQLALRIREVLDAHSDQPAAAA